MNIPIDELITEFKCGRGYNDKKVCSAILATLERIKAAEAGLPVEPDIKWIHKFINCVPFGADAPVSDIQRAHKVIESLRAYAKKAEEERDIAVEMHENEFRKLKLAEAENAALREDAERYQWLRDVENQGAKNADGRGILVTDDRPSDVPRYLGPLFGLSLDAAIDQARAK